MSENTTPEHERVSLMNTPIRKLLDSAPDSNAALFLSIGTGVLFLLIYSALFK